jgi:2-iminobutanoate/2-iminopropanoate deaminase
MSEAIFTAEAPAPIGPYSQAILSGSHLYCSGQIPLDPATGEVVEGDISAQTERALQNLGNVLRAAGFSFEDVVKTTIFLADMSDFTVVNAVYEKYFGTSKPARSTFAAAGLPKGARIEVDCIARR